MVKLFVIISLALCIINVVYCGGIYYNVDDIEEVARLFSEFQQKFNKHYRDEADKQKHYETFVDNLKEINELNSRGGSATYSINQFTDLTLEEMKQYKGLGKE